MAGLGRSPPTGCQLPRLPGSSDCAEAADYPAGTGAGHVLLERACPKCQRWAHEPSLSVGRQPHAEGGGLSCYQVALWPAAAWCFGPYGQEEYTRLRQEIRWCTGTKSAQWLPLELSQGAHFLPELSDTTFILTQRWQHPRVLIYGHPGETVQRPAGKRQQRTSSGYRKPYLGRCGCASGWNAAGAIHLRRRAPGQRGQQRRRRMRLSRKISGGLGAGERDQEILASLFRQTSAPAWSLFLGLI